MCPRHWHLVWVQEMAEPECRFTFLVFRAAVCGTWDRLWVLPRLSGGQYT